MATRSSDLLVVHITDIHVDGESHPALALSEAVSNAIGSLIESPSNIILALSGDIAQSGREDQYKIFAEFIDTIVDKLRAWQPLSINLAISPGNHDCDYSISPAPVRTALVASAKTTPDAQRAIADALCDVKKNFTAFRDKYITSSQRLSAVQSRDVLCLSGMTICVDSIDTAWASLLGDKPGQMFFPTELLESAPQCDISIALAHHPVFWLDPEHRRKLSRWYDENHDYVLMGHEHSLQDKASIDYSGTEPVTASRMVIGAAFSTEDNVSHVGFKCIQIDPATKKFRTTTFQLRNKAFVVRQQSQWIEQRANELRRAGSVRLESSFENELYDLGVHFTHPYANRPIHLDDLFVFPNLRRGDTKFDDFSRSISVKSSSHILESLNENPRLLIVGTEESGKTTLGKHVFLESFERGMMPLFLDGDKLKSAYRGEVTAWIGAAERAQYRHDCLEKIAQAPPQGRFVIVDNVHLIPGGVAAVDDIIGRLYSRFAKSLLLTAHQPALHVAAYHDVAGAAHPFWQGVIALEIVPLGNEQRSELIRRWIYLGRTATESEEVLEREVRWTKNFTDNALGKHGFPKFPIFILLILQQLESFTESKSVITSGSHGYLFEALITKNLQSARPRQPINTVVGLLSTFARMLADGGTEALDFERAIAALQEYATSTKTTIDVRTLFRSLENIDVLQIGSTGVGFRYRYLEYYFFGKNLAQTIEDPATQAILLQLASLIHTERSTNVLTFLAHFGEQRAVLDLLLTKARLTMGGTKNCDMVARNDLLLRFRTAEQRFVLIDGCSKEATMQQDRERDAFEKQAEDPTDRDVSDPLGVNTGFKLIQVLGQVLKSRAFDIAPDVKLDIARQCFGLAKRMLESLYEILDESAEEVVRVMTATFEDKLRMDREKSIAMANSIFAAVVCTVALACCSRAAGAVSSDELRALIDELSDEAVDTADELIIMGARLHVQHAFPEAEIRQLFLNLPSGKQLSLSVLRRFVSRRMFFDPPDRSTRISICDLLGIDLKPRLIRQRDEIDRR